MRIKIEFGFDGRNYFGFQTIAGKKTIQEELEKALSKLLNEPIKVVASGRTDAGVSAFLQVAHFDTKSTIVPTNIAFAVNKLLPSDIQVFSSKKVSDNFHARFSAKFKTYKYMFYVSEHLHPIYDNFAYYAGKKLDIKKMEEAAKFLIGKHDFSSFATKDKEVKNHVRELKSVKFSNNEGVFSIFLTANAFLYNMARIIVGTLFDVGLGKLDPSEMKEILNKKDRRFAGKLVPAQFLSLVEVKY